MGSGRQTEVGVQNQSSRLGPALLASLPIVLSPPSCSLQHSPPLPVIPCSFSACRLLQEGLPDLQGDLDVPLLQLKITKAKLY